MILKAALNREIGGETNGIFSFVFFKAFAMHMIILYKGPYFEKFSFIEKIEEKTCAIKGT